ncbi:MAG TPA: xanthine dehydrogenase family protein molybdopterin-binding subunit [Candidatus Lustribacter sp.]|jgi:CO/xanthine dehydrogenase Mo-binding subunit|nr:xanthine dehydrogenase family protein molybdopterin-binding subunit [Candidatus Lustribacter sp.]
MATSTTTVPKTGTTPAILGTDEARIDGHGKVSGQTKYTADFTKDGMLWAAFVASSYPHARITKIDTAAASAMAGVRAVLTGADIGERYFGCVLKDWPVLAYEQVKFVGEYVVAVAADTRALAEAAAAAVDIEYDELPGAFDPEANIAPDAPPFHPNDAAFKYAFGERPPRPHRNMHGYDSLRKGEPEKAFAAADRVFEHTFYTPRTHGGYIEPRATLVWIDDAGAYNVLATNKSPFALRDQLAMMTGLPKEKVIIHPSFIGGEFGAKALTIEEFPLFFLAQATGKPVKHVRSHADDVRSSHVRHAAKIRVKIATKKDGTFEAIDLRVVFDGGAYAAGKPVPWLMPGRIPKLPYKIEHANAERMTVYTHTIPGGFVRAPGDIQTIFAFESMLDMVAAELRIDPLELRLRNAAVPGDTDLEGNPFSRPRGRAMLETVRKEIGWGKPLPAGRGRGVVLTARHIAGGKTSFIVTAREDGTIAVDTGITEPGVGTLTVIQRVLAAELGVDPKRITVERGATSDVPWDPGIGGSKGTLLLGRAALDAARKLRAALALPHNGPVTVTGESEYMHQHGDPIWLNFGAYGVDLSVDRDTGGITIHDIVFVADIGTVINPIAHRGQIDGGFMMGLGTALTEELQIEDGRLVNIALSDYKLPTQRDIPPFRVIMMEPDDGPGPYGARAAGEFNTAGVAPAIANAIAAACGVRLDRLGLTAERIYTALQHQTSAA